MKVDRLIEMSPTLIVGVSLGVGYFAMQGLGLVAWVSKYKVAASPLMNVLAGIFPWNFILPWCVGFLSLPVAILLANRFRRPRPMFILTATLIPALLAGLVWLAVLAPPHILQQGYRPLVFGRVSNYYSAVGADFFILILSGFVMAVSYLYLLKLSATLATPEPTR